MSFCDTDNGCGNGSAWIIIIIIILLFACCFNRDGGGHGLW